MTQFFFLIPDSCPKHLKLLCNIGTRYVCHGKPIPEDQSNVPHQEFDLGKFQILLFSPVVLKFLPLLSNNTSKVAEVHFLEPLRLILAIHVVFEAHVIISLTNGKCGP